MNQIIQHPAPSAETRLLRLRKKQKDTVQLVNSLARSQAVWRGACSSHVISLLLKRTPEWVNATLAKRGPALLHKNHSFFFLIVQLKYIFPYMLICVHTQMEYMENMNGANQELTRQLQP